MLLGWAVKSPFAWSAHTTVRPSCQDITTSSPDYWCNSITSTSPCISPANWQLTVCQVSPNDMTKLLYLPLFTIKPLTSRLASSMVWVVRITSSWQLIFSAVAISYWAVMFWRLASRSYRNKRKEAMQIKNDKENAVFRLSDLGKNNIVLTANFFWSANSLAVAVSSSALACDKACLFGITSQ